MSYSTEVLADTPLAYWRLGEATGTVASDASGNAHHGTYVGSPTLGALGLVDLDTAVEFDGVDDGVEIAGIGAGVLTAITVEAWVTVPVGSSGSRAFARISGATGEGIMLQAIDGQLVFWADTSASQGSYGLPPGTHHIVATHDFVSVHMRVFVDTVLVIDRTSFGATPVAKDVDTLNIGKRASDRFFLGVVDEVAVYNTVLSPERIQAHYDAAWLISGTLAATLDDVSLSATAAVAVAGTAAVTLAAATLVAVGEAAVSGFLAALLDDVALAASVTVEITGSLAALLDDATLVAVATTGGPGDHQAGERRHKGPSAAELFRRNVRRNV